MQKIANTGTLEPLREQSSNAAEHYLAALLETPIARDQQHGLARVPGLATAWRRVDERTVELTLRPGVRFHDGSVMTAEDVAWNWGPERMFGPALPADIPAVARRHWPALDRVEATGPLTVRFVNRTPDVTMEGRLSAGGSEIVSPRSVPHALDRLRPRPRRHRPLQAAVEFRPDVSLVLDAHDEYWGGRPPCRSLRFLEVPEASARANGLLSGEYDLACDILPDQIAAIEATGRFAVRGGPVPNHRIVNFDSHHPALADPRVRLAMAQAIDGTAIVDSLWAGRTVVPPGLQFAFYGAMLVPGWTVPPFDPAAARAGLKAAGYKGDPIPYRIRNDYYVAETATAQVLAAMWQDAGLNVGIEHQGELVPGAGEDAAARPARLVQQRGVRRPGVLHRQPGGAGRRPAAGGRMGQRGDEPAVGRHGGEHRHGGPPGNVRPHAADLRAGGPGLPRAAPERELHRRAPQPALARHGVVLRRPVAARAAGLGCCASSPCAWAGRC